MENTVKNILAHDNADINAFNEMLDREIEELNAKKARGLTDEERRAIRQSLQRSGILDKNGNISEHYRGIRIL